MITGSPAGWLALAHAAAGQSPQFLAEQTRTPTFVPPVPAIVRTHAPQAADLDGDGWRDVLFLTDAGFEVQSGFGAGRHVPTLQPLPGRVSFALPVPNDVALVGTDVALQHASIPAGAGAAGVGQRGDRGDRAVSGNGPDRPLPASSPGAHLGPRHGRPSDPCSPYASPSPSPSRSSRSPPRRRRCRGTSCSPGRATRAPR